MPTFVAQVFNCMGIFKEFTLRLFSQLIYVRIFLVIFENGQFPGKKLLCGPRQCLHNIGIKK